MKKIFTIAFLICFCTVYAQDVKVQGPKRQQTSSVNSASKSSKSNQNKKRVEPLRWDDSLKAICYDGQTYPMVQVKGGFLEMGEKYDNTGQYAYEIDHYGEKRSDNSVHYSLTMSDYYIGIYEVPQDLWQKVMGNNPSRIKGKRKPVTDVAPDPIREFLSKLSALTGLIFRLPTEEQWEFAAKGGKQSMGYKYSGSNSLNSVGWYCENSGGREGLHDIGMKNPNELGIFDMSGNVEEFCDGKYGYCRNIIHSYDQVVRGGSYYSSKDRCTSISRGRYDENRSGCAVVGLDYVGFRIVLADE